MAVSIQTDIKPGKKKFFSFVSGIVLFILGRGLSAASRLDPDVRKEVQSWPEGFSYKMKVWPNGPSMAIHKVNGFLKPYNSNFDDEDVIIYFRNVDSAFLTFTAQISTPKAYAQHRIFAKGDIGMVMSFVRCLDILEGHLFPRIINRLILRRKPKMGFKKQLIRLYIYLLAIPFGL